MSIIFLIGLLTSSTFIIAQGMPVNDNVLAGKYPFVKTVFNRILNSSSLDSFYLKLYRVKSNNRGVVSVIHIGDSHSQADFFPGMVRNGLQDYFGNAGRGLVFPYQLAQSNSPADIKSHSDTRWQFNRLAHPEISIAYGISGYGIRTNNSDAALEISIDGDSRFNHLTFFNDKTSSWFVRVPFDTAYELKADNSGISELTLHSASSRFSLFSKSTQLTKEFYGVSLSNDSAGVIYHTIGVNGARIDSYNNAELFWEQLPALKADLYIVSLGTNDAQRDAFNANSFNRDISLLVEKLKKSSPGCAILFTTAPDSYKRRRFNAVLKQTNLAITDYCNRNFIALWDLYQITNGYGSAYSWARRGLMNNDRIHFTAEGYYLQGNLLMIALGKAYNESIKYLVVDNH